MKAYVCTRYGPPEVLELRDVPKPEPKDGEVLIKIRATTVNSGDWRVRSRDVPRGFGFLVRLALGWSGPRQPILGTELAGDVEAVGKSVRSFKVGDAVLAFSGVAMGCHAEYKVMREGAAVVLKPARLGYDEAATLCFGGTTMLDYFRRGNLERGDEVLVNGASGTVGVAAVQLAKHFGARVTAVCSSTKVELVRSLGADEVIDYKSTDFTQNGKRYDVIVDTAGTAPYARSKGSLKDGGRLLVVLGDFPQLLAAPWLNATTQHRIIAGPAAERLDDVRRLAALAEAGELKPVIDRRYPFERMLDAHRYVDQGHKAGSVVVEFSGNPDRLLV
jgi:NADPH:quinone reductase-like Zn-dependent oxidoreductase